MLSLRRFFAFLAPYDCLVCGCQGDLLCTACLADIPGPSAHRRPPPPLHQLWVAADYDGAIKQALQAYKFDRARDVVECLAVLLDKIAPPIGDMIITYVPTATGRIRERGYDHARVLAESLARRRGLVVKSLLVRHGQTRQVGADRTSRLQQAGVYEPRPGLKLNNIPILLIDDIITTGATLGAAARALQVVGGGEIHGLVIAQK